MALFMVKVIGFMGLFLGGNRTPATDLWVSYTASFGRQGADCAGRGVCSFVENAADGNVRVVYSAADSLMTMQIINEKVGANILEKQITPIASTAYSPAETFFEMEGDYVIPQTVKAALGIPKGLQRIPKGKYTATGSSSFTIVQFKIK